MICPAAIASRCSDPNGAGKTTLLKALAGLLPIETGTIDFHCHESGQREHDTTYLPQREQVDWDFPVTVRALVEMGRYVRLGVWRGFGAADVRAVDEALAAMDLDSFADRQISALSGGQQQRAFLARSLAQQAHIILLDEPFAGLDQNSSRQLAGILRGLAQAGRLVLASHHDLKSVPELFDRAILLNGEMIAEGTPDGGAGTGEHPARLRHESLRRDRITRPPIHERASPSHSAMSSCSARCWAAPSSASPTVSSAPSSCCAGWR